MKRFLSSMLVLVIVLTTLFSIPTAVSAESMYIRKIVSVVYDDSGSMGERETSEKWANANYAMQAFCGMLNSEDRLFIAYMSKTEIDASYEPEEIDLSSNGIQGSVDDIRGHSTTDSTPYKAVEKAYNKLKSVDDSNVNTQYWLVVITDGSFDEHYSAGMTEDESKEALNDSFGDYTEETMPNGTHPQVTFLAIGNSGVISPDEDETKGIYTYEAKTTDEIIDRMAEMADRVSGRTRLDKSDLVQVDSKTIQVSSSIPLLNIAVFAQETDAVITKAVYSNELDIPISRKVSLSYPNFSTLVGGAFLVGDSQNAIGAGTYNITFDKDVSLDNVVVLFEPALEMRMIISVNGKEIADYDELDNTSEGDKISVSYKIFEMGTENEIDSSLMPPDTTFEIAVSEDGKVVDQKSGEDMLLSDYILKNIETEIKASVIIKGFNPIDYSVRFTPAKPVPKVVYTITPSFGSDVKSVKLDDIASNKDLTVCFTVYADGVAMTDPDAVKALNPVITPAQGSSGTTTYSDDGKIVFTPTAATAPADAADAFEVDVTCTIDDGTSATEKYTVLISDYEVIAAGATESVKKTGFFDNKVGVSFQIKKDGVQLDKSAVEKDVSIQLSEEHAALKTKIDVASDGTITVTPYTDVQHKVNFKTWWCNWRYYFGLPGEDVNVTLSHPYGSASATIDVTEETLKYQILFVYLPLVLEAAVALFLLWWAYCIIAKPKFLPDAVIYMASINHRGSPGAHYHEIGKFEEVELKNRLKDRLSPTLKSKQIPIGRDIVVSAASGGSICSHSQVWYAGKISPQSIGVPKFKHPEELKKHINKKGPLKIDVLSPYDRTKVKVEEEKTIDKPHNMYYYVHASRSNVKVVDGIETITKGTIFVYTTHQY